MCEGRVSICMGLGVAEGEKWGRAAVIMHRCGSERVPVVSTEPLDDLSCLTTLGVCCPGDGLLPVPLSRCILVHTLSPCWVCRLQH